MSPGRTQLLDVLPGRNAAGPSAWLEARDEDWRAAIRFGVLDLSGPYRKTFDDTLPDAIQVADPFHLHKLANSKVDARSAAACRTRRSGIAAAKTTRSIGRGGC